MIPSPKDMLVRQQAAESHVTEPCEGGSEYVGVREMMVIEMILYVRINMVDKVPTTYACYIP